MASSSTQALALQGNFSGQNRFMGKLMAKIFSLYDEQSLTDVTFKVSNPTAFVPAHRLILAAASPYFENIFNGDQGNNPIIEINDIDSDIFERLITFCYTGQTLITINNVDAMLKAAIVLKLDDAITSCVDYLMAHINEYTIHRVYTLEVETHCKLLMQKISEYETNNFMEISQSDEFLNFDVEKLLCILESDNLNITREEDAFDAVNRWFNYDIPARQEQLPLLIACLRLTQFDVDFLLTHIQPLPGCELLAFKALSWISKPEIRTKINMRFTGPRGVKRLSRSRVPEAQPKINMQIKGPREVDAFSFIKEPAAQVSLFGGPEAQPKINMQIKGPRGVSAANCGEKTLLVLCSEKTEINPKLLQYNKAEDKWQEYASIKFDYKCFRTILKDNNILFIGGSKMFESVNIVRSWNIRNKIWQRLPAMNQARHSHCVVELDGKIYAIGGCDRNTLSSVERYTTSGGWEFMKNLTVERYYAGAVSLNGKIYIMGGLWGFSGMKSVECYNAASNTWNSCADMTESRTFHCAAAHNGRIYVLGDGQGKRTVERYDPQQNRWSKICSLQGYVYKSVSLDNKLWAIGVTSKSGDKLCVSVYDEENDRWEQKCALPASYIYSCFVVPEALLTSK